MNALHRWLDRSARPTFAYERVTTLVVETLLLVLCAIPGVTGLRSAVAASLIGVLRLVETELQREEASVMGRHIEQGGVSALPPAKEARAATRRKTMELVAWTWPALTLMLQAAERGRGGIALLIAIGATLLRVAWYRRAMPWWRRSRVAWRSAQAQDAFTLILLWEGSRWAEGITITREMLWEAAEGLKRGATYDVGTVVSYRIEQFFEVYALLVEIRPHPPNMPIGGLPPLRAVCTIRAPNPMGVL